MKKTLRENLAFLIPYLYFLFFAGIILSLYQKADIHLFINQYRSDFFDVFFYYTTYLGDGIAVTVLALLLCLVKYRYAVIVGLCNIIAAIITQTLKHTIFSDQVRPKKYFEGIANLNLIPGVENYYYNSFPSGHTTAAFSTFFCLALITENRLLKFLMFVLAFLIGFSRVYLSQHFLNDVYAGSLIGTTASLFIYQYCFLSEKIKGLSWLEKSILKK